MEQTAENKSGAGKFIDKIWYGTGAIGLDLSYGMFNGKLSMYLTDVLRLKTGFLLWLTPLARIWDGVNDPMMGSIVDHTNTKRGRYRPWVIAGACMNAVILFLLFFNPGFGAEEPGLGVYVYIAVMYILWGMTNTTADIPYWSMVPSFTTDPKERSILATVARTFSGLGQGLVQIGAPLLLDALGVKGTDALGQPKVDWTQRGYTVTALICAAALVFFALLSMSRVKETVAPAPAEKFSFRRIFDVLRYNNQLRVFMLFAMLSNAGFYTTSGVVDYYFSVVVGEKSAQSAFNLFGAVGAIAGLGVIPVMLRFTSRRRIYQGSLATALVGYVLMFLSGGLLKNRLLMNLCYLLVQIGTASMFVSQTVFLADVVDYGEVIMGSRAESVTFSMKGFLQKMAYTLQTIILFSALGIAKYNDCPRDAAGTVIPTPRVTTAVNLVMFAVPPVCFLLSLLVFSTRFRLHGAYMEDITRRVSEARERRLKEAEGAT